MLSKFIRPPFNSYNGKTDPVEHVSHYIQMMSLHTHNNALICRLFPLGLGPTALRWFNGLQKGLIHNFSELIQEFGVWFMTCNQVPQPMDALLSMTMGLGKPSATTLTGIGSYTARLAEVTKKSRRVFFG